jgi:glycosyltransferase involved in cell wall biosynthesis
VLLPCLHDEPEARTVRTGAILRSAAVRIFSSEPERALAARLHGPAATAGSIVAIGVDAPDAIASEAEVRVRYGIVGDYLVYVGRQESGKELPSLVAMLRRHNRRYPEASISLVMVGAGRFRPRPAPWLRRTGFVDERTKFGLMQGAVANITFSRLEALSITLLEGWSVGVPAIVHAASEVLRTQVERALGGYVVNDDASFATAVRQLREPSIREAKGSAGASFVRRHYAWDDVMARFVAALSPLLKEAR